MPHSVTGEPVYPYAPTWRPLKYIRWLATTDGDAAYSDSGAVT